jgi:hypothetical protein
MWFEGVLNGVQTPKLSLRLGAEFLHMPYRAFLGYPLKAGQLTYDCRYSTMHSMPVTGGRGFRGLKPLWYNSVPP